MWARSRYTRRSRLAAGRSAPAAWSVVLASAALGLRVAPSAAQSIDPPLAIYEAKARSSVMIENPTLFPMAYVVELRQFDIACNGDLTFRALDTAKIHLRLSSMSGRLGAKQRTRLFYEASADSLPAWFSIVVAFMPARPTAGLSIRLELPHTVYLMQRPRVLADDVTVSAPIYDSVAKVVRVHVENHSSRLTRIVDLSLVSVAGRARSVEACPLFPRSARDFEFPWSDPARPAKTIVRFPDFEFSRDFLSPPPRAAPSPRPR